MANTNMPRGLVPLRDAGSKPHNGGVEMFYVPASDGTALYIGDPVVKNGSADSAGVAGVVRAAAAGPITGVVQGFLPDGTTNMAGFRAASTAAYVLVNTDPDTLYEIQDTAGTIAAADIGLNANMTAAAGSASSKRSGFVLDAATKATTATLALKIVGLSQRPGNEFGAYAKVLVKINNTTEANASAGL
jgi:hypothetical protein